MSHELQMAYEFSQATTDRDPDGATIGALLDQGRHVVVMDCLDYCRITDATLSGTTRRLSRLPDGEAAAFATLKDAAAHCDACNADEDMGDCGETSYRVLAPDGQTVHPVAPPAGAWHPGWVDADSSCPF